MKMEKYPFIKILYLEVETTQLNNLYKLQILFHYRNRNFCNSTTDN